MDKQKWRDFKDRYPQLAEELIRTGSALYEMGAEKAKTAPELDQLVEFLHGAPEALLGEIGFELTVDRTTVLAKVFENGSEMLLNYLHNKC